MLRTLPICVYTRSCRIPTWMLGIATLALIPFPGAIAGQAQEATAPPTIAPPSQPTAVVGTPAQSTPSKHEVHEAESAYKAGAKKLEQDDLSGAEQEFQHALKLNPQKRDYAIAISVVREHRVNELVRHSSQARLAGDEKTAQMLLAEARTIDPQNQMVIEHSGTFLKSASAALQSGAAGSSVTALGDRAMTVSDGDALPGLRIEAPVLASAIHVNPNPGTKDFDLRGQSAEVARNVALAYGVNAVMDDSVKAKNLRFNLQHVTYDQAMSALMDMAHVFTVPVDEMTVLIADDSPANRQRLERQMTETVYVPGMTQEQLNELVQLVRTVFDIKQATIQTNLGALLIRAPQSVLDPLNTTLQGLIDGSGEVMVEVKLYEVSTTRATNVGATIPQQFTVFNVDQAANQIVNSNQALVQQAIAQGYITSGTSNLQIALALIDLGLVQSNLATNLIGTFGGGLLRTGVSGSTNVTINLNRNTADTRSLDDIQMRVGDHQAAIFREGERYPIIQSTYNTGLATAASALGNATINGVNVSSLLSQYAGTTTATIPQVTYEDLGITLKATPVIEKSGRINLLLDMKIEALSGSTFDGNPVLESRQFSTDLTVANGDSAMLVSNVTHNESNSIAGLPGLSELPGFQVPLNDTNELDTGQLVVIVTPHIVRRRSNMVEGPRIPMAGALDD